MDLDAVNGETAGTRKGARNCREGAQKERAMISHKGQGVLSQRILFLLSRGRKK
jgi:hypothetical protein